MYHTTAILRTLFPFTSETFGLIILSDDKVIRNSSLSVYYNMKRDIESHICIHVGQGLITKCSLYLFPQLPHKDVSVYNVVQN